jgi:hypothetical protein
MLVSVIAISAFDSPLLIADDLDGDRVSMVQFSEAWFDRNCFGQLTAAMAERRCHELLKNRIELADETVPLSDELRLKLQTAGQIDIHRFMAGYAALKSQFQFGDIEVADWQVRIQQVNEKSQPLILRMYAGLNGPGSLYQKTLTGALNRGELDQESIAQIQQAYHEHTRQRFAMLIEQTLRQVFRTSLDRHIDLAASPVQSVAAGSVHQLIIDRLLTHTSPPEFYGNTRNHINIVIGKMIEIEDQLVDLLTAEELALTRQLYESQAPAMPAPRRRLNVSGNRQ